MDILGNVVPYIGGEDGKLESEPLKILGSYADGVVHSADFRVSAQANRVPFSTAIYPAFPLNSSSPRQLKVSQHSRHGKFRNRFDNCPVAGPNCSSCGMSRIARSRASTTTGVTDWRGQSAK